MTGSPTIRLLHADEMDRANYVIDESFRRYLALIDLTPETAKNPYDYLPKAIADNRAWGAELKGELIGAAQVDLCPDGGWKIDLVAVLEPYAKLGLGRALMDRIEADARARNVPILTLITLEKAKWLWQFYERLGFKITDRAPPAHGLDDYIRVSMEKILTE